MLNNQTPPATSEATSEFTSRRGTVGVVSLFLSRSGVGRQLGLREIPVAEIRPRTEQPRKHFSEASIADLAASIASRGLMQPVGVRPHPDGGYELIWGERRFRAVRSLGWETIPAIVTDGLTEQDVLINSLLENIQRENLSAIETAMALRALLEQAEALGRPMTHEELGKKLGLSRSRVSQMLNIFNLPEDLLDEFCAAGAQVNEMHARALMALKRFPEAQRVLLREILATGMTGQQAVDRAKELKRRTGDRVTQIIGRQRKEVSRLVRLASKVSAEKRAGYRRELTALISELQDLIKKLS
ncbi:MAG: ParB/RepB/Spo0J family partition protein [Bacillota bacterium]